ncbi:hypothetical protein CK203_088543 [Vitis vinifera]|uniref:Transmembrane protein adipocyte-associated 1 n=1 Tax=Vitis vinifera TaxID=29760 RepID=A0A438EZZ2_VITVI|nr:hypothetical protein CK203_088543 [Vitis vinifera]
MTWRKKSITHKIIVIHVLNCQADLYTAEPISNVSTVHSLGSVIVRLAGGQVICKDWSCAPIPCGGVGMGIAFGMLMPDAWECTPEKAVAWNVLSLFTTSGMLFLEVSLVAFLLQGNYASGLEALTRTFVVSGLIIGLDLLLKVIYLFGFGVPLFIDNNDQSHRVKWGLWVVHKLVLTAVYGFILFMYHSKWRERLPARPAFYKYITIMCCLNALALFACGLTGNGAGFGFWLYGLTMIFYHAFYLPLLYITFLADFFQEEDLHLENVYYSEMKDAGFFDADWE